jgi:hypothetical protein
VNINKKYINILQLGLSFVPTFSKLDLYYYLYNFYDSISILNKYVFYSLKYKSLTFESNNSSAIKEKSILQYLNKLFPSKSKNIPILSTTIAFHNDFLKKLFINLNLNQTNSFQKNLDFKSFNDLLFNIKSNNIIVSNCDKNIGIALIEKEIYYNLCFDHLNDTLTYKKINQNPQFSLTNDCKSIMLNLFNSNHISSKLYNKFISNILYKKLPSFKILPKLHKEKFGVRPLVNCSDSTLSILSIFLDFFLKQFVIKHYSYIQDSQHLIQLIYKMKFDSNSKLHTADVESLYTNIPLDEAIIIISDMMSKQNNFDFDAYAFHCILKLTLKSNYFYFKSNFNYNFYLQIKGVAMGTQCGP